MIDGRRAEVVIGPTGRPMPVLPEPEPLTQHGPARVVSMTNQKGGVGKTTTTINLGASLAEYGRKVLLVDFDPQGSLSVGLGLNPHEMELTDLQPADAAGRRASRTSWCPTNVEGMDLLPSNIDLSAAEVQLVHEVAREQTLQRVLAPAIAKYDVILIDCQPSLGLLTVNALTASDGVIVPLECEYFALRGVALLKTTIDKVRERLNPKLEIDGVLGTMFDGRTLHSREVMAAAGAGLGGAGLPHRHPPDREVLRLDRRGRADHVVRLRPRPVPRPTASSPRRCSPGGPNLSTTREPAGRGRPVPADRPDSRGAGRRGARPGRAPAPRTSRSLGRRRSGQAQAERPGASTTRR